MSETTGISWTDSTFNPWQGCTKISPGCDSCYAEARDHRFGGGHWGAGAPRKRTSAANWKLPERWNKIVWAECMKCEWRGADGREAKVDHDEMRPLARKLRAMAQAVA